MDTPNTNEISWRLEVLPRATQRALKLLSEAAWLRASEWYLAGGTALALQVGHRSSVDLDFFLTQTDFAIDSVIKRLPVDEWITNIAREGTIYGSLLGAKVSFIAYPFFVPKELFLWYGQIRVLNIKDIATMKIVAISQRGRKRDFVDLYWYLNHQESLALVLKRLPEQYPNIAHDYHHILKSLVYFADAEEDPMPKITFPATWKEIKKFFNSEVPRVTRHVLNLKETE